MFVRVSAIVLVEEKLKVILLNDKIMGNHVIYEDNFQFSKFHIYDSLHSDFQGLQKSTTLIMQPNQPKIPFSSFPVFFFFFFMREEQKFKVNVS